MSEFEFVLVAIAIVAGFAISEILSGWGRSLLAAGAARYSGLQFFASLILLFQTVRYLWTLWDFRSIQWLFSNFVLALVPVLVLALSAHVISIPDAAGGGDPEEHYFARARPFYLLQVALAVSWSLYDLVNLPILRNTTPAGFMPMVFAVRAVGVAACTWLAFTRRRSHHWVFLSVSFAYLMFLSIQALPVLPE